MLKPLIIPEDELTPKVVLDKENNMFEIFGKSLPEDSDLFYTPVLNWVKNYVDNPNENTVFNINLNYFNSSSVRKIVDILIVIEKLIDKNKKVTVKWFYERTDEMMRDIAEDFQGVVRIPFEMIAIDDDD